VTGTTVATAELDSELVIRMELCKLLILVEAADATRVDPSIS
jgi:hypothetical protein